MLYAQTKSRRKKRSSRLELKYNQCTASHLKVRVCTAWLKHCSAAEMSQIRLLTLSFHI